MAFYHYVNNTHELAQVAVGGAKLDEVQRDDFKLFVALPDEEMEVYAEDHAAWSRAVR